MPTRAITKSTAGIALSIKRTALTGAAAFGLPTRSVQQASEKNFWLSRSFPSLSTVLNLGTTVPVRRATDSETRADTRLPIIFGAAGAIGRDVGVFTGPEGGLAAQGAVVVAAPTPARDLTVVLKHRALTSLL
ncbi:hypothetical protein PG997_009157 [Apiospora hydei]|uniref:Uncharacterized protein n=1 Tax=Apiospora hydei TaxID=1337664 RepID=A0ABR1VX73_9PEZI